MENQYSRRDLSSYANEHDLAPLMATFAIILNRCEISFDQDSTFKPQFFQNKQKVHVFLKKHNLWFVLVSLEKTFPVFYLARILEFIALKVR